MNRTISELFDLGEAPKLQGPVPAFDPQEIKEMTMKHIQNISQNHPAPRKVLRRTTRTLLIAAVIASLLTVTALAVGLSIHQRRQSELREALLVEENQLTGYVEAILPETSGAEQPGLVLLSTINDGEFQRVYVNISPIFKEEVFSLGKNLSDNPDKPISHELSFTLDGEHFGIVLLRRGYPDPYRRVRLSHRVLSSVRALYPVRPALRAQRGKRGLLRRQRAPGFRHRHRNAHRHRVPHRLLRLPHSHRESGHRRQGTGGGRRADESRRQLAGGA